MAATIVSFRWLEILEKEFDKNFVDLDLLIEDLDAEEPDFVHSARQKLAGLSSCFAQLTHKAQTIFQNSAKIEKNQLDCFYPRVQRFRDTSDSNGCSIYQ
ncbi:pist/gopc/cal/fig, putative [Pediculus humanus corporis]|uniref:Pist/gopc/cal/fig, putative n=1 Tax=Pediculus humanus subsp. corporis TaxID=121224 RepID=E0W359_PEDHC|nr:pist/gopc/cal/fig, putative [Pediculus humanus corporis]EEB20065.1 pist/gopc/cal/fig, putative [Pediculus humanus corporis]